MAAPSTTPRALNLTDIVLPDGRNLRVRTWPGRGAPLVLLHGLLDDSEGWAQLAQDSARPCIAVDLPGFGGSDLPAEPTLAAYAQAVGMGLAVLDPGPSVVVGHSLGGGVAALLASHWAGTQSLALLAPAGFGRVPIAEIVSLPGIRTVAELSLPLALVNPLTVTAAYTTFVAHHRLPSRDLMSRVRRRAFRSGPGVKAAVQALAASGKGPLGTTGHMLAFQGPVAALWGEHDALISPGHADALQHALPQAHVEVWEGMGHHPQRERPAQLARFIEENAVRGRRRRTKTAPRVAAKRAA